MKRSVGIAKLPRSPVGLRHIHQHVHILQIGLKGGLLQHRLRFLSSLDCLSRSAAFAGDLAAALKAKDAIEHRFRFAGKLAKSVLYEDFRTNEFATSRQDTC